MYFTNGINNKKVVAFLQTCVLISECLNYILVKYLGSLWPGIGGLFLGLLLIFILIAIFNQDDIYLNFSNCLLLLIITSLYFFSYYNYGDVISIVPFNFLGFSIFAFLVLMPESDYEQVLRNIIYFSIFALPFSGDIFGGENSGESFGSISMGMSYYLLPLVLAALFHYYYYFSKKNNIIKFGYLVNCYYAIKLISTGTRGVIICMLFSIILVFFGIYKRDGTKINKRKPIFYLVVFILTMVAIIFILNFENIIYSLNNLFLSKNIKIAFIQKTSSLAESNNIGNGRIPVIIYGLQGFLDSPIFGNGIGVFKEKQGLVAYPHNLFVQLLFDGGLLLTLPIIYFMIKGIKFMAKSNDITQYTMLLLLFCTSVPRLMISQDLWLTPSFWMLMGYLTKSKYNVHFRNEITRNL